MGVEYTFKVTQITFVFLRLKKGAWVGVVVKALRYNSVGPGIDSKLTFPCALGSIQRLKNEYQDIPYHFHVPSVKKSRSLNILDPSGPAWSVTGELYLYLYLRLKNAQTWYRGS